MTRIKNTLWMAAAGLAMAGLISACSSYRTQTADRDGPQPTLEEQAAITLERLEQRDESLRKFRENAHAYAVLPEVAKGAAGIGAAHGEGVVYENGQVIGYTTMTQGSIGAQLGGQVYSEVIFFEDDVTLERFKKGNVELSARASAVAASSGAAAEADYEEGIAIFTMPRTGLMFEAAVGGQKFTYEPREGTQASR